MTKRSNAPNGFFNTNIAHDKVNSGDGGLNSSHSEIDNGNPGAGYQLTS